MNRIARALGCTEGQAYTVTIGVVLAVALAVTGIPPTLRSHDLSPVAAGVVEQPVADEAASPPTTAVPSTTVTVETGPSPVIAAPTTTFPPTTSPPSTSPSSSEPSPPVTVQLPDREVCDPTGLGSPLTDLLGTLDLLTGGVVPDQTTLGVFSFISGCGPDDPMTLALAALTEVGVLLPDLGPIDLPVLPIGDIPQDVFDLFAPLRPALGPVCEQAGVAGILLTVVAPQLPSTYSGLVLTSVAYTLNLCGRLAPGQV